MYTFLIFYTTFELYSTMGERGYFNFEGGGPVNFNKQNYSRKEGDKKMV